ncbi:MAG: hypothetical protein VX874_01230 [Pseudomonadota bacterium]|nr:hypothetical protein [Pseudomonadota bacterium]
MDRQDISCRCGTVRLQAAGLPSGATICHCAECQTAAMIFEHRFNAFVADAEGGTFHILWRKDRLTCVAGSEHLAAHRLASNTPTDRVIATCCGTPMYLDRKGRPWVGLFADRVPEAIRPAPEMRVFAKDRVETGQHADGVRTYAGYSRRMMIRRWRAIFRSGFDTGHLAFVVREV